MLCDHQVQGTNVVIDQLLILGKLLYHVDGLEEDVQQLFVPMEQLLTLSCLVGIVGLRVSGGALVVLVDEVLQSQLSVEHSAVLPFFDRNIVQKPARSANELAVSTLADLEQLFFDAELVVESLASQVLLQLTLEDQVKDSFLGLHAWHLQQELSLLGVLVAAAVRLDDLEDVRIERVVQMLDGFYLMVWLLLRACVVAVLLL